jgi:hypothetical protein
MRRLPQGLGLFEKSLQILQPAWDFLSRPVPADFVKRFCQNALYCEATLSHHMVHHGALSSFVLFSQWLLLP